MEQKMKYQKSENPLPDEVEQMSIMVQSVHQL